MKKIIDVLDFEKKKFSIVNKKVIWFILPLVVLLATLIAYFSYSAVYKDFSRGINLGIDFTGGTVLNVQLGSCLEDRDFYEAEKDIITEYINDAGFQLSYAQRTGEGDSSGIQFKYVAEGDLEADANEAILDSIRSHYASEEYAGVVASQTFNSTTLSYNSIGATASSRLIWTAVLSLAISSILILIYVAIRFESRAGLVTIIGQLHDVAMMICFTIIFHVEINSSFVAAIITIIGYSINNTIVVLDRIRENMKLEGKSKENLSVLVDKSVKQTMMRSFGTTFTTFVVVLLLCVLGVASMQEFCLPIIFGLLCGLVNSLLIAPSLFVSFKEAGERRRQKKAQQAQGIKAIPQSVVAKDNK